MSKIVEARDIALIIERKHQQVYDLLDEIKELQRKQLRLMFREPAVRRARQQTVPVTDEMREEITRLSKNRKLTQADIARRVGLRNGGRVSEILTGKR